MRKVFIATVIALAMVSNVVYAGTAHSAKSHKGHSHSDMEGSAVKEAAPAASNGPAQATCPVMGDKIDRNFYTEYQGQRIYFCCVGCVEKFKKDPDKYMKKLEQAGVQLEKVQTTCPVMGGKIDKKMYTDYQGQRIYFCCTGCVEQFKKDPEKYMKKIADSKVALESVQKTCPITGKPIDRNNFAAYKGRRVYFSSPDCAVVFNKDPEKYLDKLNPKEEIEAG